MVLDAIYFSKLQRKLQHGIHEIYNYKHKEFSFSPLGNTNSLELDYLLLISSCRIDNKKIISHDFCSIHNLDNIKNAIKSEKKDANELVTNFLIEMKKILQPPVMDFSKIKTVVSDKSCTIINNMGVNPEEAISFLDSFMHYFSIKKQDSRIEETVISTQSLLNTYSTNNEIISLMNSFIFLFDNEISNSIEYEIESTFNFYTDILKQYVLYKRINSVNVSDAIFEKVCDKIIRTVSGQTIDKDTYIIDRCCQIAYPLLHFQRQYFIFKLGFIASQCEPDLEKAFEMLTSDN